MTPATVLAEPGSTIRPGPYTLVLKERPLRPGTNPQTLSRYSDVRWNLSQGIFAEHADAVSFDFATVPDRYRESVKLITWLLINHEGVPGLGVIARSSRPALQTVSSIWRYVRAFTLWLEERGIACLAEVTTADLDAYAVHVRHTPASHSMREDLLAAVLRTWTLRELLPESDRLPPAPPWGGERTSDILGIGRVLDENRTPRIHPATMTALLAWSLRFVETFADDITTAFEEYKQLSTRNQHARIRATGPLKPSERREYNSLLPVVAAILDGYRSRGHALPGRREPDGTVKVNIYHLHLQANAQLSSKAIKALIEASGLPVDEDTYISTPITAHLDGAPWLGHRIPYEQAPILARHLSTACFVITAYLSGQRPSEALSLKRGCIERDTTNGLVLLRGRHYKSVFDQRGEHKPEGEVRTDPWTVVEPVAHALATVERLHEAELLFPNTILVNGKASANNLKERVGRARGQSLISVDITRFVEWVNDYCRRYERTDAIPPDPAGEINPTRLRRTLAWFIVRKPRGLVAAAIQYGHVNIKMTLGYSGSYASGFPDDLAFEQWLDRIDTLADAHERLNADEHVSGPAAAEYRARVTASPRFAGQVLRTGRHAQSLLNNPELQIFPGKGMTCVLDPAKAACRLAGNEVGTRRTPDLDDCRPTCANIARTDTDIDYVRSQADALADIVADPLAPPIRHGREQRELARLHQIITRHDQTEARP